MDQLLEPGFPRYAAWLHHGHDRTQPVPTRPGAWQPVSKQVSNAAYLFSPFLQLPISHTTESLNRFAHAGLSCLTGWSPRFLGGGRTWDGLAGERTNLDGYVPDHWLTDGRGLEPTPPGLDRTRRLPQGLAFLRRRSGTSCRHRQVGDPLHRSRVRDPFLAADELIRVPPSW